MRKSSRPAVGGGPWFTGKSRRFELGSVGVGLELVHDGPAWVPGFAHPRVMPFPSLVVLPLADVESCCALAVPGESCGHLEGGPIRGPKAVESARNGGHLVL